MEPYIKKIFAEIILLEGGIKSLTNIKNDRGGLTRAGLTASIVQKFYTMPDLPVKAQMEALSEIAIYEIYHTFFWKQPQYDKLFNARLYKSATLITSATVNHGQKTAITLLQMVCNEITTTHNSHGYQTKRPYLKVDGIIGPKTINIARNCIRFPKFITIFIQHNQQYYNAIVINEINRFLDGHPEYKDELTQHHFLAGWSNRLTRLSGV